MNTRPGVLVVGNSVLMEGVALSLMERHSISVDRMNPQVSDIKTCAAALRPELIVFEIGTPLSCRILSLLYELPGTMLLGVDLNSDRAIVMNSRDCASPSMLELHKVLESVLGQALQPHHPPLGRERNIASQVR